MLPAAPAAMAEITLVDVTTSTTTPGTTTTMPGTTTTPGTTTPTPTTKDPAPNSPMEALVSGSSGFKLGAATGSSNTNSAEPGTCTVAGSAAALGGFAALGCGANGPGTIG
ncbi:hypothetical protein D6158_17205 [Nocardia seriolae]|nr:hypothetical protein D6158_17205 [Nocardia seriolae]